MCVRKPFATAAALGSSGRHRAGSADTFVKTKQNGLDHTSARDTRQPGAAGWRHRRRQPRAAPLRLQPNANPLPPFWTPAPSARATSLLDSAQQPPHAACRPAHAGPGAGAPVPHIARHSGLGARCRPPPPLLAARLRAACAWCALLQTPAARFPFSGRRHAITPAAHPAPRALCNLVCTTLRPLAVQSAHVHAICCEQAAGLCRGKLWLPIAD